MKYATQANVGFWACMILAQLNDGTWWKWVFIVMGVIYYFSQFKEVKWRKLNVRRFHSEKEF